MSEKLTYHIEPTPTGYLVRIIETGEVREATGEEALVRVLRSIASDHGYYLRKA